MLLPPPLSLAQLVERFFYMEDVVGSNPAGKTKGLYRIAAIAGDCKSPPFRVRRFESFCRHKYRVVAQLVRATA